MKRLIAVLLLVLTAACTSQGGRCVNDADCVPAQCCHPTSCVHVSEAPDCDDVMCTMECAPDTMDCGQGSCVCQDGECAVSWAEGQ